MSDARPGRHRSAVLVSGSGSNLQALIDQVAAGRVATRIVAVISDRPGVLALERAAQAGIPAITIDYSRFGDRSGFCETLAGELAALAPDLVVLAGFMRILTPQVVQPFSGRMLNVHPSLLPRYPGLHTYRRALEANDAWHGSTVHFVTPELDAGPALIQYRVAIRPGDTEDSLRSRVQRGEHLIYPRAVGWLASGRAELRDGRVWLDGQPIVTPVIVDE
jgi:phosphoribosylglycinamide formyltransferase-1